MPWRFTGEKKSRHRGAVPWQGFGGGKGAFASGRASTAGTSFAPLPVPSLPAEMGASGRHALPLSTAWTVVPAGRLPHGRDGRGGFLLPSRAPAGLQPLADAVPPWRFLPVPAGLETELSERFSRCCGASDRHRRKGAFRPCRTALLPERRRPCPEAGGQRERRVRDEGAEGRPLGRSGRSGALRPAGAASAGLARFSGEHGFAEICHGISAPKVARNPRGAGRRRQRMPSRQRRPRQGSPGRSLLASVGEPPLPGSAACRLCALLAPFRLPKALPWRHSSKAWAGSC